MTWEQFYLALSNADLEDRLHEFEETVRVLGIWHPNAPTYDLQFTLGEINRRRGIH
jgi:hypothetical protein